MTAVDQGAFLGSRTRLEPQDAAAALLQLADGRYVLQLRDSNPKIFYPDHWGCFGGAVDAGETAARAVVRELAEELGLRLGAADCAYFTEFTFDFGFAGHGVRRRHYYAATLPRTDLDGLVLTEGAALGAFTADEALGSKRLVPYDAFAIWMHHHRGRMAHRPGPAAGAEPGAA
jgi:8-oxo-dGTP pyrophosphatase MutT (NUDIX family)